MPVSKLCVVLLEQSAFRGGEEKGRKRVGQQMGAKRKKGRVKQVSRVGASLLTGREPGNQKL